MHKKALFLVLFFPVILLGQTTASINKDVTAQFVSHYNNGDYSHIFEMFSSQMQEAQPLESITSFLGEVSSIYGKITAHEFVKNHDQSFAMYKATGTQANIALSISIDQNAKINGLLVTNFLDKSEGTEIQNQIDISNGAITQKQADLIFEKVKNFPEHTQLAIALIKAGEVSFFGLKRNKTAVQTIANSKSVFEIGSISKVFTATLLASFVTEGKLALTDPVNPYLGVSLKNDTKIPFKALANHTSGLFRLPSNLIFNPSNPYIDYKQEDLKKYLSTYLELPQESVGNFYSYSNLGAGLLGYTLSNIAKVSYEELLQQQVFSVHNMSNSTTEFAQVKQPLVKGLNTEGNEVSNWGFSVLAGAGGILSTVEDLSKFALAQFDERLKAIALTQTPTFKVNDKMSVGLGWHLLNRGKNKTLLWHNGATGGYSSSMVLDIQNKTGTIILSNVSGVSASQKEIDVLNFKLLKAL